MRRTVNFRDLTFLVIGTLLLILSICLISYDKIELLKSNVFDEIELEKYKESNKNIETPDQNEIHANVDNNSEIVDEKLKQVDINDSKEENQISKEQKKIEKEFIGYLQIDKVNLKQGLVSKNSYYNNVNRNIAILTASDYPDQENGNVILAAHSGTSSISYFKHLYQLSIGDEASIYYKDYIYNYRIVNIYNVPKTGSVTILRDINKTTLTLITCTHNSKVEQTVYILELYSKTKESD